MGEDGAEGLPERYRMTALKCLLVGELKRQVELRDEELSNYEDFRNVIMKYAVNKKIEKERGT